MFANIKVVGYMGDAWLCNILSLVEFEGPQNRKKRLSPEKSKNFIEL